MFLTSVRPAPELIGEGLPDVPEHMRRLGALIAALPGGALRLPTPVTVVVGDNGAGKGDAVHRGDTDHLDPGLL